MSAGLEKKYIGDMLQKVRSRIKKCKSMNVKIYPTLLESKYANANVKKLYCSCAPFIKQIF